MHCVPYRWRIWIGLTVLSAGCGKVVATSDAGTTDLAPPMQVVLGAGDTVPTLGMTGADRNDFTDACPSGQALIGYSGATGMFSATVMAVGQLIGHCGSVHMERASTTDYTVTETAGDLLAARGLDTASRWELPCPANQFVVALVLRAGTALDQLNIQCAPVSLVVSAGDWVGKVGSPTLVGPAGGMGGGPQSGACPPGQIATTSTTRVLATPIVLGGMGLGCSTVTGQ